MKAKRVAQLGVLIWITLLFAGVGASYAQHAHHNGNHGDASVQLEEVVVTAEKIEAYIENHPQQVTVMTRGQIDEGKFTNMDQVLNAMPGVDVKKSGSGIGSRISIRGSGNSGHILVLINGRPANSTQYGGIDLASIPLSMVKRVDVFKPPVPVWLGPGGASGAINIVLANPNMDEDKKRLNTRIGVLGGSYGKAGVNASHLMAVDGHKLRLVAGVDHYDGRRTNSDRDSGNLSMHWDLPNSGTTRYDINGRYYQSEHGSAGPTYNPTPRARQSYRKGSLDLQAQGVVGEAGGFEIKAYLDTTRLEDKSQSGVISTLDALTGGLKGETSWHGAQDQWALRMTTGAAQDQIEHTLSGDHHREQADLGVQSDYNFDILTTTLGVRCDYTSDFGFQPAGNAGIGIPVSRQTMIKVNMGYTVNVPSFGQLYQPSHGAIDQVRGNPDLKEERIWSWATGITHTFAKDRTVEMTLFREDTHDMIGYEEGVDFIKRPVNIDSAWRQGLEAVLSWKFNPAIKVDLSWIWQQTQNERDDNELSYTPNHKFQGTVHWTLPTQTRVETTITAVTDQYSDLDNTAEKIIDAYQTVDLKVIHPFRVYTYPLEVFVDLENLLDTDFESHYGYPDEGFRVTIGANIDF